MTDDDDMKSDLEKLPYYISLAIVWAVIFGVFFLFGWLSYVAVTT